MDLEKIPRHSKNEKSHNYLSRLYEQSKFPAEIYSSMRVANEKKGPNQNMVSIAKIFIWHFKLILLIYNTIYMLILLIHNYDNNN